MVARHVEVACLKGSLLLKMSIHTLPLTIQVQGISLLLPKELELLLLLVLLELGMMAGGVQRWVVVKHRLALLDLKEPWRILVFVVQMLLIVTICTPASAEDFLLGLPLLVQVRLSSGATSVKSLGKEG